MRDTLRLFMITAVVGATACATGSQAGGTGYSRDLISAAEIAEVPETNAYDIVRRLRSSWLRARARGVLPVAYLDNIRLGHINELRGVHVELIEEIRFISAADATTRWGTDHAGGVIQVMQKR